MTAWVMRALALLWVMLAWACGPGPQRILGSISNNDSGTPTFVEPSVDASRGEGKSDDALFPPVGWPVGALDAAVDAFMGVPQCVSDDDCASLGLYCDLVWGRCVDCTRDVHCGNARPYCRDDWNICVECESDSDCFGGFCDVPHGRCRTESGPGAGP